MLGRTNVASGGSAALNFAVVGGTTQPSNPKENTIWVDTSAEITSYIFSATEPSSPTAGMVWFLTGASSSVAFAATEENVIMLYPNACKQYVSGAWVDKTAISYIGGEWVSWDLIIYTKGDENTFTAIGYVFGDGVWTAVPTVDYNDVSGAKATINNRYDPGVAGWRNTSGLLVSDGVDLSGYSTVTFEYTALSANEVVFYVSTENDSYNASRDVNVAATTGSGIMSKTIDVSSLSGVYYIGIGMTVRGNYENSVSVTIVKIVAE